MQRASRPSLSLQSKIDAIRSGSILKTDLGVNVNKNIITIPIPIISFQIEKKIPAQNHQNQNWLKNLDFLSTSSKAQIPY